MDFRVSKKNKLALCCCCCCRRHHLQLYIYTRLTSRRLDVRKPYAARSQWLARANVSLLMSSCSLRSGPMRLRLVNWSYVDDKRAATRRRRRYHGKVTRQVVGNKILDDALQPALPRRSVEQLAGIAPYQVDGCISGTSERQFTALPSFSFSFTRSLADKELTRISFPNWTTTKLHQCRNCKRIARPSLRCTS